MPNKQIVEYYQSFQEMLDVNDGIAHALYEKWRNKSKEEIQTDWMEFQDDLETSVKAFAGAWDKKLGERHLTEVTAKALWEEIRGRIGY